MNYILSFFEQLADKHNISKTWKYLKLLQCGYYIQCIWELTESIFEKVGKLWTLKAVLQRREKW